VTKIDPKYLKRFWRRARLVFGEDNESVYRFLTDNFPRPGKAETRLHDLTKLEFNEALTLIGQTRMKGSKLTSAMFDKLFWLAFQITQNSKGTMPYLIKVCQDKAHIDNPHWMDGGQYRIVCEALKHALIWRRQNAEKHA
jgi:hypothetical protein